VTLVYVKEGDLIKKYHEHGIFTKQIQRTYIDEKTLKCVFQFFHSVLLLLFQRVDVIYINEIVDVSIAAVLCKTKRCKLVCHLRLPPPDVSVFNNKTTQIGIFHSSIDNFIVANNNMRNAYQKEGVSPGRIKIIPNGFWFDNILNRNNPLQKSTAIKICFLGRITQGKGLSDLVWAFHQLLTQYPNLELSIGGTPKRKEHFTYLNRLEEEIVKLEIKDKLNFYGHIEDPIDYLGKHDLCVFPSLLNESFGRVVVESLIAGTPIIARDVGAIAEIMDDQKKE
jgi:glycosyltransferase involved in cell wall biosynthesis